MLLGIMEASSDQDLIRYTNPAGYLFFLAPETLFSLPFFVEVVQIGPKSAWFEGGVT